jgi:hypothetical protein
MDDGALDHHVDRDKPSSKTQISHFCSYANLNPKIILILTMRHERLMSGGRGKERVLADEHDQSTLYIYEDSVMKPTKYCLKREIRGRRVKKVQ